ncbi:MAG: glycosyltransferase family 2 protein [Robiginitomaculum sp.]
MDSNIIALPKAQTLPTISVVMVSYFTGPALLEAIAAVLRDRDIFELIIVDNGNTDSLRKSISDFVMPSNRVRLLQGHGNIGFGRGCNYGAGLASGDYILFLNPDAVITEGTARIMTNVGASLTAPWIVGGMLRGPMGAEQRGARRGELTPLTAFFGFTGLAKFPFIKGINRTDEPMPAAPVPMPTVSGAALMLDRASFNRLDGFDERYFLHVEDIDICRRARLAGGQVYFAPSATVMHYGATSDARVQTVEFEKLKGFIRYFWNYSDALWAKALCLLSVPFMAIAIMGRAWVIIFKKAIKG